MIATFQVLSGIATFLVLEERESVCLAIERADDDVDRAPRLNRIAQRVLELRPDTLIEIGLLRDDVRE
jgi:hypothetical protein